MLRPFALVATLIAFAGPQAHAIRVAIANVRGLSPMALEAARAALSGVRGITADVVTAGQIQEGYLSGPARRYDAVLFGGGRGHRQADDLGREGREAVRDFVRAGGGYVGICAGSYMAMEGTGSRLAIVHAEHTGPGWERGVDTSYMRLRGSSAHLGLHYENGPMMRALPGGSAPVVTLATFITDVFSRAGGTTPGVMPGSGAILASSYGEGRIILFSPNPTMDGPDERAYPELLQQALRWVSRGGAVSSSLTFDDVFDLE